MKNKLIYLDNAATTFPKPRSVLDSMVNHMQFHGGNPGRGGYSLSISAAEAVYKCRSQIVNIFHSNSPENVVFTYNTTYALNLALKSIAKPGDLILISNLEHNSVFRPIYSLFERNICHYDVFDALHTDPNDTLNDVKSKLRPTTSAIVVTHASNVCGATLPLKEIGELCRQNNLIFIVDAAQSAGIIDINFNDCSIDALCAPAHKGLYGPQGCGFVLFSDRLKEKVTLQTLIEGGSGVNSLEKTMPAMLPERLEAGTLGVPAIAGLSAGMDFVNNFGIEGIHFHEKNLKRIFTENLLEFPDLVKVYAPEFRDGGTVLFNVDSLPSEEVASRLARLGICVRGGFHCSPLAHNALGTGPNGAVRASFSVFNTAKEAEIAANEVIRIAKTSYKA